MVGRDVMDKWVLCEREMGEHVQEGEGATPAIGQSEQCGRTGWQAERVVLPGTSNSG